MSSTPINSFLEVNGVEVANAARTIEYMRRGLAGPYWNIGGGCDCAILYTELGCSSAAECFVSPAVDPAPWYSPDIPQSGSFLGIIIPDLRSWFDGVASRAVTPRVSGLGGASIGPMHDNPRPLVTQGTLVAMDPGGIEYGRRWLQYILGQACDPCDLAVARLRSYCPDPDLDDPTEGEWFAYEVGLIDGVTQTDGQNVAGGAIWGCQNMLTVEWTLNTGNPFLYKRRVTCVDETLNPEGCSVDCLDFCHWLQDSPPAVTCTVDPPPIGTLCSIITITAGAGLSELTLEVLTDCSPSAALDPLASMFIPSLPAGSTLVVDSALQQITYDAGDGSPLIDGTGFISLPFGQGVPWLAVGSCNEARCIAAQLTRICDSDCTASVKIEVQIRED